MIGKNQVMIADMSLMPITLIISPKKTTWEQFKSFQRSLEHKFITFFLSSATKEQLKLEIFFISPHGSCLMKKIWTSQRMSTIYTSVYLRQSRQPKLLVLGLYSDHPWSWCFYFHILLSHRAGDVLLLPSPMWRKKPWGRGWFRIRELGDGSANENSLSYKYIRVKVPSCTWIKSIIFLTTPPVAAFEQAKLV